MRTSRGSSARQVNGIKPVEKIELDERHIRPRLVLLCALIALALCAFGYGVYAYFKVEPGYQEVTVAANASENCGAEFRLNCYVSGRDEGRQVQQIYTQACEEAYRAFVTDIDRLTQSVNSEETQDSHLSDPDVDRLTQSVNTETATKNRMTVDTVDRLTQSVNTEIATVNHSFNAAAISPLLCSAIEHMRAHNRREIFLAPVYEVYNSLFFSTSDEEARLFDPEYDDDMRAFAAKACDFARNSDAVNVDITDEGAQLQVSPEYLAFADEYGINRFVDFYWMSNAYIADYIADALIKAGYADFTLASYDGFSRSGAEAAVFLRDYPSGGPLDASHYYVYKDGIVRFPYIDIDTGLCAMPQHEVLLQSDDGCCADLLIEFLQ